MIRHLTVLASAGLLLGACATTPRPVAVTEPPPPMVALPPPPPPQPPEILAELPVDAPPGECYARVVVPGQPVAGPPQAQGATWVQTPGPPGSPGPIWCLIPTGPAPVAFTAERYGFIRVLCETDLTRDRVVGIQRRLHDGGYYAGAYTGVYDAPTAQAVTQFQGAHHISHGGYLSTETVRQLETIVVQPQVTIAQPAPVVAPPIYQPPIYQPPVVAPPIYAPPIQAPGPVYGGYASYQGYQGGYAAPAAAVAVSASAGAASAAAGASYGYQGGYTVQSGYGYPPPGYPQDYPRAPLPNDLPPQAYGPGYNANYYGTSGYAGYGQGWWSGPGMPGGVGSTPQLPYPLPYQNYGPGPAAWPAPGFGPQGYPRPAYAAPTSAVQSGWLNWSGKTYF